VTLGVIVSIFNKYVSFRFRLLVKFVFDKLLLVFLGECDVCRFKCFVYVVGLVCIIFFIFSDSLIMQRTVPSSSSASVSSTMAK